MSEKKFLIKEMKAKALSTLNGHWGTMVLATLVYFIVSAVISAVIPGTKSAVNGLGAVFMVRCIIGLVLAVLVSPAVMLAYTRFTVKFTASNGEISAEKMFSEVKPFKKAVAVFWAYYLKVFLWSLPLVAICLVAAIAGVAASYGTSEEIAAGIAVLIGLAAGIPYTVFLIKKAISFSMCFFISAENPETKAFDTIKQSVELTKGSCGRIFLFELSFIGWIILGTLTLCIGLLWAVPYESVASYHMYKELCAKK